MPLAVVGARGAKPVTYREFLGYCKDVDATELPPYIASDAQNVDFDGLTVRKRLGKVAYNTSFGAGAVLGAAAYYPKTGVRKMLAAWTTTYKADDGAGTFSSIATGLNAAADHADIFQYQDRVYLGNGLDPLYRWNGTGSAAAVALITAPTAAPSLAARATVGETFETATTDPSDITIGWVLSGSAITLTLDSSIKVEGSNCLKVQATGAGAWGSSVTKKWSGPASGKLDLSTDESLVVWVYAEKVGITFQVGIVQNGATTVDFTKFRTFVTTQKETWVACEIPLGLIPPENRTSSPGLGIRLVSKRTGLTFPVAIFVDQAMPKGPLDIGRYQYRYTWLASGTGEETNPSPVAFIDIATAPADSLSREDSVLAPRTPPVEGVFVTAAASGTSSVDTIRIYRYFELGTLQFSHVISTAPNKTTTLGAAISTVSTETVTLTAAWQGVAVGNVLTIDTERLLVRAIAGAVLTCSRGVDGTTAATHSNGATVTFTKHFDAESQGTLVLSASDRLIDGRQAPPLANCYAMANHRMFAADVTIGGTRYPWQLWISREGYPEEFRNVQNPGVDIDPTLGGWINLPVKDPIRRILEYQGAVYLFCDRSVWSLEGSGWDNYEVRRRAFVGLDARWAIAETTFGLMFLAEDGVRLIRSGSQATDYLDTYGVLSEPVNSILRAIPKAYRGLCSMGVDERHRIHLSIPAVGATVPNVALVFDPLLTAGRHAGAMMPAPNLSRPGWTYYTNWGASCFVQLKRGGGDNGELLAADPSVGKLTWLHRDSSGNELYADDGATIAWLWQSACTDASANGVATWESSSILFDKQDGAAVTLTAIGDRGNKTATAAKTLPANTAVTTVVHRWGPVTRARFHQLKINGTQTVDMRFRSAVYNLWPRAR